MTDDPAPEFAEFRASGRAILDYQLKLLDRLIDEIAGAVGHPASEADRVTIWMLQALGVSIHSILKLTTDVDMAIRDCFGIARSAAETAVNVAYINAKGPETALRAVRHMRQKRWRDLKRTANMNGIKFTVQRSIAESASDFPGLPEALDEFTNKKGQEVRDWTSDNIEQRIAEVGSISKSAAEALSGAIFTIYRPSSEILHGSFYGVNYFWQGSLDRPVQNREEFKYLWTYDHFVTLLSSAFFASRGAIDAVATARSLPTYATLQIQADDMLRKLGGAMAEADPDPDNSFSATEA